MQQNFEVMISSKRILMPKALDMVNSIIVNRGLRGINIPPILLEPYNKIGEKTNINVTIDYPYSFNTTAIRKCIVEKIYDEFGPMIKSINFAPIGYNLLNEQWELIEKDLGELNELIHDLGLRSRLVLNLINIDNDEVVFRLADIAEQVNIDYLLCGTGRKAKVEDTLITAHRLKENTSIPIGVFLNTNNAEILTGIVKNELLPILITPNNLFDLFV